MKCKECTEKTCIYCGTNNKDKSKCVLKLWQDHIFLKKELHLAVEDINNAVGDTSEKYDKLINKYMELVDAYLLTDDRR
jgi:hypothetical protein